MAQPVDCGETRPGSGALTQRRRAGVALSRRVAAAGAAADFGVFAGGVKPFWLLAPGYRA